MLRKAYLCIFAAALGAVFAILNAPYSVQAHGGGVDSLGCHNDRPRGNYHCHRGPLSGRTFSSQAEARAALAGVQPASSQPAPAAPSQPTPTAPSRPAALPAAPASVSTSTIAPADAVPYDRELYRHWIDADADCQDTRQEVLVAESLEPPRLDERGCRVISGRWFDPFTGQLFTDPGDLDIDHFVPLAEVHRSGGDRWTPEQRQAYANNLFHRETLIAVSASTNRSKGDRDPAEWLPPNQGYRCEYVKNWVILKATWGLVMDAKESAIIRTVLSGCP